MSDLISCNIIKCGSHQPLERPRPFDKNTREFKKLEYIHRVGTSASTGAKGCGFEKPSRIPADLGYISSERRKGPGYESGIREE
ncbi:MAG: hypothetical protein ACLPID_08305 [Beijerinckiaceae bacterium]